MPFAYPPAQSSLRPSALIRALRLWLLTNLGGTCWLALDFGLNHSGELVVPLVIGLMAALISLAFVPFMFLFFSLAHRACVSWRCQLVAVTGVVLVFILANFLLLQALPIGPADSLLSLSRPYLGAAVFAVVWLYGPQGAPGKRKPAPATRWLRIRWQSGNSINSSRLNQQQSAWH